MKYSSFFLLFSTFFGKHTGAIMCASLVHPEKSEDVC